VEEAMGAGDVGKGGGCSISEVSLALNWRLCES